jgi:hypothetical protein
LYLLTKNLQKYLNEENFGFSSFSVV